MTTFLRRHDVVDMLMLVKPTTNAYAQKLIFYARKSGKLVSANELSMGKVTEAIYTLRDVKRWLRTLTN